MIVITIIIIVIIVHDYRNVYHCDYGPIPATTMFVWYEHPQFPAYAGHAADPSHIKNHPQLGRVRSSNVGDWGAAGVPIERAAQAPSLSIIQISWECVYVYIYNYTHTHTHTHIYIYTQMCICRCNRYSEEGEFCQRRQQMNQGILHIELQWILLELLIKTRIA